MKWIGQHIWDFISRFRSKVYFEDVANAGSDTDAFLVKKADGEIAIRTGAEVLSDIGASAEASDLEISNAGANRVVTSDGGTDLNAESTMSYTSETLTILSSTSEKPKINLMNTNTDAEAPMLQFFKTPTGADDDEIGELHFYGYDDQVSPVVFTAATFKAFIADATDGDEAGKIEMKVGTNSTETQNAFTATGLGTGSRVDVSLGYGAASTTTIAGTLTMGSTAAMTNAGLLSVAGQTNITSLGTLTNLQVDDVNINTKSIEILGDTGDTFNITTGAAGATTITTVDAAGSSGNLDFNIDGTANFNTPSVVIQDYYASQLTIQNTANNDTAGALELGNTQAGGAGEVGDGCGLIMFKSNDDANNATEYARISAEIGDPAHLAEEGKLTISVASHDGESQPGLFINSGNAEDEVDVTIGNGATSVTTIAGTLTMGSTAAINNDGQLLNGNQSGITRTGTLTSLIVDDIGLNTKSIEILGDTGDTFNITTGAAGATTLTTTDAAGANGHLTLSPDGDLVSSASNVRFNEAAGFYINHSAGSRPSVEITNNADDATGPNVILKNMRDGNGLENDDVLGTIHFQGEDSSGNPETYGSISASVVAASHTDEAGKIAISVANDGTERNGIAVYASSATAEEVDVIIANGADSVTTIAGEINVTSKANIPKRKFTKTADGTHFEAQGDILYFGGGSTTQGDLCYLKEDGEWGQADASGAATGDDADRDAMGMLAIALGTDPDVDGMLLRGTITMDYDLGDVGNPIYVSTAAGNMTGNPDLTSSGDFIRVVGYCLDDANGQMWFNPDNAWVEIA